MRSLVWAVAAVGLVAWAPGAGPALGKDAGPRIAELIEQLGTGEGAARQRAGEELQAIGAAALPALREATRSGNRAVATRAEALLEALTDLPPARRAALREEALQAFRRGDYPAMAAACELLTIQEDVPPGDWVSLGHARQLQADAAGAAVAYRTASLELPPETWRDTASRDVLDQTVSEYERHPLILLAGRLQRDEAGDLVGAAQTFLAATRFTGADVSYDALRELWEQSLTEVLQEQHLGFGHWLMTQGMAEAADALERAGHLDEAIEVHMRLRMLASLYPETRDRETPLAMTRLLHRLPPGAPWPDGCGVIPLTPDQPECGLDPDLPASLRRAWRQGPGEWTGTRNETPVAYAFAAPAGQEFATVEFSCDVEMFDPAVGTRRLPQLHGFGPGARDSGTPVAALAWPEGVRDGRQSLAATAEVPPGCPAMRLQMVADYRHRGEQQPAYRVRSFTVRATFRPAGDPPPSPPWVQADVRPAGGVLTADGEPFPVGSSVDRLAPGPHVFEYALPGHGSRRVTLELQPGRRYAVCLDLDSPFTVVPTNLVDLSAEPAGHHDLAALPDGRWLAAYVGPNGRLLLATSRDGRTWDQPHPLPVEPATSQCEEPALLVDHEGTIWLAWFSNRLMPMSEDTHARHLWLAHSTDAVEWSAPRPILCAETYRDVPQSRMRMVRAPDGRYGLLWRQYAAWGASPADLATLEPCGIPVDRRQTCATPHLVFDAEGRWHLAYGGSRSIIWYTSSANGQQWDEPVELLARERGERGDHPFLLLRDGRMALLYHGTSPVFLQHFDPEYVVSIDDRVQVLSQNLPPTDVTFRRTSDGRIVGLVGRDMLWWVEASEEDLLGLPAEPDAVPAARP